ncbi:MAG TPA: hypothetical protein PKD05_15240 [Candidatus Melainabacteria bacterium]|nr:hypothetical protein [Candidatus Melainabacteria bacterium]HMP52906.1 hypothetical protein [Candidatus Melainabacteria bacterium]
MKERLGCELEHVWLTVALACMPLFFCFGIPAEFRGIVFLFVIAVVLILFAPYTVLVTEAGLTITSISKTMFIRWVDIKKVKYNNTFKLLVIYSVRGIAVIPFGIWVHTGAPEAFYMLMDYVNTRLDVERVEKSSLF